MSFELSRMSRCSSNTSWMSSSMSTSSEDSEPSDDSDSDDPDSDEPERESSEEESESTVPVPRGEVQMHFLQNYTFAVVLVAVAVVAADGHELGFIGIEITGREVPRARRWHQ